MTPLGFKRNFIIILDKRSLKVTLGIIHAFYIWDSKAVFLVVTENLRDQKRIIIEEQDTDNHTLFNTLTPKVLVENFYHNSKLEPITEVCKIKLKLDSWFLFLIIVLTTELSDRISV